jgi:hypothetical protein
MKFLLAMTCAAFLSGSAYAQTETVTSILSLNADTMMQLPNKPKPSGRQGAPNRPRLYGRNNRGAPVNPDRVPPLSPGGQGTAADR